MKDGMRKPNIKKSISARTTGKVKRTLKSSIDPTYGKKGMGYVKDPEKAVYNKVYNKTSFSALDMVDTDTPKNEQQNYNTSDDIKTIFTIVCFIIAIVLFIIAAVIYFS